ncbi:MAG: electron transfer flavoprotein subunit alpha/FixB family protein [Bacteroidota bacterium]|nr:electron transfer flavoprotein subunit alpha/FixB family protein [Bacteroidota bacterium]MDP4213797.1 electron transfer flavoprotein subunit alpha/FixB family protein [Bacteroidota bacterium]MDP4250647.1 electron transfer flavoprotein subunit alpha/FixB family protein [Bacteroidota bacterium]
MSILVFIDHADGHFKKTTYEALSYGAALAKQTGTQAEAVLLGTVSEDAASLGKYGIQKVHQVNQEALNAFDPQTYIRIIAGIAQAIQATVIVFSHNSSGKAIAPGLSARLKAGLVTGAIALPDTSQGFLVKKNVFSGKAFAIVSIKTPVRIISLNPNAYPVVAGEGSAEVVQEALAPEAAKVKLKSVVRASGEIPLTEAEIVVSGGRGMKGPENWGPIEELAKLLHAATACSRPVADAGWRPHGEHVGQTGVAIAPNLYIAVGISGAIQHLAGVNRSKVIVVINKDPEAPFFKAADYGIAGDAFEVLPKLIGAVKKLRGLA